jgi:hypothetical protein
MIIFACVYLLGLLWFVEACHNAPVFEGME